MNRRNPFDELEELFDRMGRQFEDTASLREVAVDVADHDEEFVVTADLPGYSRDAIDLTLEGRQLRIDAERDEATTVGGDETAGRYVRRERTRESVSRTLSLPDDVVAEDVSATYANGVLTVHLPKATPDDGGHRIQIE
jgi:HSP20 family protein